MASSLRYVVLTSDDIEAALAVNYLIRTTGITVDSIFLDTRSDPPKRSSAAPDAIERPAGRLQTLGWHVRLALRLPRSYFLRLIERVTGLSELRILMKCERLNPSLFRAVCGFPLENGLRQNGRLLFTLDEISKLRGVPVIRTPNLNNPDSLAMIAERKPDVLIGLGTRILKPALLDIPRLGCLNGHSSLLPAYRGSRTEFWQLAAGETKTGVTIHWMASRVDQGDICLQKQWDIPRRTDHNKLRLMSLFNRLEAWRSVIEQIEAGDIPRRPQGPPPTPTFRKPSTRQYFEFYCKGIRPSICSRPLTTDSERAATPQPVES